MLQSWKLHPNNRSQHEKHTYVGTKIRIKFIVLYTYISNESIKETPSEYETKSRNLFCV